jgi:glycogen debranching enzyme
MTEAWILAEEPPAGGQAPGTTTLIEGTTFCISGTNGDIDAAMTQGLFVRDTRFVSCWRLHVGGVATQPVSSVSSEPFSAAFVSRIRPSAAHPDPGLLVARRRSVGDGMVEELELRNLTARPIHVEVAIEVDADFAHLFEVKADRVRPRGFHSVEVRGQEMIYSFRDNGRSRRLKISLPPEADAGPGQILFSVDLGARDSWRTCFEFRVELDEQPVELRHVCGEASVVSSSATRLGEWRWEAPRVRGASNALSLALSAAIGDLGALRIYDPDHPDEVVIAAGAPWYLSLFGRDSLITSWMTLGVDPMIASGTLRALARHQGVKVDDTTEEEPGRILHEVRFRLEGPSNGAASAYYGAIDSTPLFVMVLGEAGRWGASEELVAELLPNADRAIEWIENYGDRDGDGFVEYARPRGDRGLVNQGWKDSTESISFVHGRLAEPPIALCEVQGYVYAAYVARHHLACQAGDSATARRCAARAESLKEHFNEAFFLPDRGYFALGLDGHKRPIDALASNMGHLLWSGIVDQERAEIVAARLLSPELFSGWGVRTLATSMARYNPMSYHNGSVWPHDNAIIVAGLMRYGLIDQARRIVEGMLDASTAFGGHLPELFCGFDRSEFVGPIAYPAACTPQAWASATPWSLLRSLLRLEPDVPDGRIYLAPFVPESCESMRIENVPVGSARISVELGDGRAKVSGLPPGLQLIDMPAPRPEESLLD